MHVLVGDIGGTNTRLLYAEIKERKIIFLFEKNYLSKNFKSFTDVLNRYIADYGKTFSIDAACFAIAGPVENGTVAVTNLPWLINENELKEKLNTFRVHLINDFMAVAYGIPELKESDVVVLQNGENIPSEIPMDSAVIGAGTGLGASHLVYINDVFHPLSSEVGHTGFAPENSLQSKLLIWMQTKYSHVSLESILSGDGLLHIYHFLREEMEIHESEFVKKEMKTTDPSAIITKYALSGEDELCQQTLNCFIEIYGAAAGNVALNYYPISELYIAGGIAAKVKSKIMGQNFIDAFVNKGLLSSIMKKITVKLILQEKIGLYGALAKFKLMCKEE